jgi:4-alpha-glucanotransferase
MRLPRCSGVLLHPISLPGPFGSGDLGPEAYAFVRFLSSARQRIWQVLPLHPAGVGNSPYQPASAFAGNPLLISLGRLREQGWLTEKDLSRVPAQPGPSIDYGSVIGVRDALLRKAAHSFADSAANRGPEWSEYEAFCAEHADWLDDYALFMAARDAHGGKPWTQWEPELAARRPDALKHWSSRLATEIAAHKFYQWEFFRQWKALRVACHHSGIRILGDLPFYVGHDSADVWSAPRYFSLDHAGNPQKVGGVPPDYFSATGQLWGCPTYRWEAMREDGFRWWKARLRAALRWFDVIRLDHFRGYEAYYEIAAGARTAVNGHWVPAPGRELFEALRRELGELPLIAENLGVIGPEVEALRSELGFPGMAILQFAFGNLAQAQQFRPHRFERNLVACTGTHDNDTVVGWWTASLEDSTRSRSEVHHERERASSYLNQRGEPIHWTMIRALMASVADIVLFPLQDLLGLGSTARMNHPARREGNWQWRCLAEQLRPELAQHLRSLVETYER